MPEKNSGLNGIWTHDLWNQQCNALPTELTNQLGAGNYNHIHLVILWELEDRVCSNGINISQTDNVV